MFTFWFHANQFKERKKRYFTRRIDKLGQCFQAKVIRFKLHVLFHVKLGLRAYNYTCCFMLNQVTRLQLHVLFQVKLRLSAPIALFQARVTRSSRPFSLLFSQYRSCDEIQGSIFLQSWTFSCSRAVFLMNTKRVKPPKYRHMIDIWKTKSSSEKIDTCRFLFSQEPGGLCPNLPLFMHAPFFLSFSL